MLALVDLMRSLLFVKCGSEGTAKKFMNKVSLYLRWTSFRGRITDAFAR